MGGGAQQKLNINTQSMTRHTNDESNLKLLDIVNDGNTFRSMHNEATYLNGIDGLFELDDFSLMTSKVTME